MNRDDVDQFEKLTTQLNSLHSELSVLAKKSPNDALNKFKLKFVNKILESANDLLGADYQPFDDFVTFPEEDVPSNSDATFIVAQYIECAEKFRSDNIRLFNGQYWWRIEGEAREKPTVRTAIPKKLQK